MRKNWVLIVITALIAAEIGIAAGYRIGSRKVPALAKQIAELQDEVAKLKQPAANYRTLYSTVAGKIHGTDHDEAFDVLREAAAIAIGTGQSQAMLYDMERDEDGDLTRLKTHREWADIKRALRENNPSRLPAAHEH